VVWAPAIKPPYVRASAMRIETLWAKVPAHVLTEGVRVLCVAEVLHQLEGGEQR
jgi:hypothetical protein